MCMFYSDFSLFSNFYCSDSAQSGSDNLVLEFNMSALSALLKRQSEQNPSASYFNVEILRYQVSTAKRVFINSMA